MTDPALVERITRSLAYMLRHQPETFDLELDPQGYADLDDVVQALNERLGEPVEEEDVRDAVLAGDRPRYEIVGDRIRALYGHSIPVDPGPSAKPPEFLYVAIPEQELERARRFGLRGGRRRFLHLASTHDDAAESGRRASREYAVLVIHALDAWEEGISFYDRTSLWLAEEIPTHLIEVEGTYDDGTEPVHRHFDGPRDGGRERDRGPGRGHDRGGERHGRGGRGRRGRGRDRDRQGGSGGRDERGGGREGGRDGGRSAPREAEHAPSSASGGEERGRWSDAERAPRDEERSFQGERAAAPRGDDRSGRGGGRREGGRGDGRRDERSHSGRPEREGGDRERSDRGRPDRSDRGPERHEGRRDSFSDSGRDSRRSAEHGGSPGGYREPRRERQDDAPRGRESESDPRSAPRPVSSQPGGGFGAGLEAGEESRRRAERAAAPPPAPRPTPPPRREESRPVDDDRPSFGAGL